MPPSKDLRANVLKAIETDFERVLKSHAGPINEDLVAYRRRRCRRFNHLLRKDMQCYSGTSDDGRWFIECRLTHPGDIQGSGPIFQFISAPLDPKVLQESRDHAFARRLQAGLLLPSPLSSRDTLTNLLLPVPAVSSRVSGRVRTQRVQRAITHSATRPYGPRSSFAVRAPSSGLSIVIPGLQRRLAAPANAARSPSVEVLDPDAPLQYGLRARSRSPSLEIIERFAVWLFLAQNEPPQAVYLDLLPGATIVAFRDYVNQWEGIGFKFVDRVKVLAASNNGEHLWQFGHLFDIRVPINAGSIVVAEIEVDCFHPRLSALVDCAFTGSFSRSHE